MKTHSLPTRLRRLRAGVAAFTLAEVLVAAAITAVTSSALFVGITTVQRTFRAAEHHAKSQSEQARIIDYIARDLRRALTVRVDSFEGTERL